LLVGTQGSNDQGLSGKAETHTSENLKFGKVALLGHVIRAGIRDAKDPMCQDTFEEPTSKPKTTSIEESAAQETNRILTSHKRHGEGPNITQKTTNQNTKEQNNKDLSSKQSQTMAETF